MELSAYWLAVKSGWRTVLAVAALVLIAGAWFARPGPASYTSTTELFVFVQPGDGDLSEVTERAAAAQNMAAAYTVLARSGEVARRVGDDLGYEVDNGEIASALVESTRVMQITVTADDPERARDIAAAYGEALPSLVEETEAAADRGSGEVELRVVTQPDMGTKSESHFARDLLLALLAGLGLGASLAVLRYAIRQETSRSRSGAHGESS